MKQHRHFIIHKPYDYVSQFIYNETRRKKNKKLLGMLQDFPEGTMAIGRLDKNSEGLLFLTTDGKVSEQIRSKKVEKEYYVELDGEINDEAIEQLQNGVTIRVEKRLYTTLPCKANRIASAPNYAVPPKIQKRERHRPTSWLSITITEGKNRQIRKMTAVVGFPTLRLIRVRIGAVQLKEMVSGEVIEVDGFGAQYRQICNSRLPKS